MKKLYIAVVLVLLSAGIFAQTKQENIKKLINEMGSVEVAYQVVETLIPQYVQLFPQVPEEYWNLILEQIKLDTFITMLVEIYDKYYTEEDIIGLLSFYQSPLGKKVIAVLPQMTEESMIVGQRWGQELAAEILHLLESDGYYTESEE